MTHLPRFESDATLAELSIGGATLEAVSPEFFAGADGSPRFGFCWRDVSIDGLPVGHNPAVVRVYDAAGNFTELIVELRVHPWIETVSPDLVHLSQTGAFLPPPPPDIRISGVGLEYFDVLLGDAVRIDDRDVAAEVSKETVSIAFAGTVVALPPVTLALRVPPTVSPGGVSVRVAGLESNRVSFEVCRTPEAAKFVAEVPTRPIELGGIGFAMERGPAGEPVFYYAVAGAIRTARADGDQWQTATSPQPVTAGSPIAAFRFADGSTSAVFFAGQSLRSLGLPGIPGGVTITLPAGQEPISLDAAVDPSTDVAYAVTVTAGPVDEEAPFSVRESFVRVFRLDGSDSTGTLLGSMVGAETQSFASTVSLGPQGTGWILASAAGVRAWERESGAWIDRGFLASADVVSDVATSETASYALIWRMEEHERRELGHGTVDATLVVVELRPGGATIDRFAEAMDTTPAAFRPPPSTREPDFPERMLARAAAVRINPAGRYRIAFANLERKTLRLLEQFAPSTSLPLVDILDLDVVLGHHLSLAVDGNGESLVGYADLSHATSFDPEEDDERNTVSVQLIDTRNNNAVRSATVQSPSRCSPHRFDTAFIGEDAWREIRDDQAARTRFQFQQLVAAFNGNPFAGEVPTSELTADEARLRVKQAGAGVFSRLLAHGSITFAGRQRSTVPLLVSTQGGGHEAIEGEQRERTSPGPSTRCAGASSSPAASRSEDCSTTRWPSTSTPIRGSPSRRARRR